MINEHAEFKDACQELETRIEEIANDIQGFPTDYKLAEKYIKIDDEICEVSEWYQDKRRELINFEKSYQYERRIMDAKVARLNESLKKFNNVVQSLKLQEFSRGQHGGSYSRLSPYLHQ